MEYWYQEDWNTGSKRNWNKGSKKNWNISSKKNWNISSHILKTEILT
jgi:hypothetical protein